MIIDERPVPFLKLALGGTAVAVAALLVRRLLKQPMPVRVVVKRAAMPERTTVREAVDVPWVDVK